MANDVPKQVRLDSLPERREFIHFTITPWMIGAPRIGPDVADVDIAKSLEGSGVLRRNFRNAPDIFVGCLRTLQTDTSPCREQTDAPIYLHG